MPLSDEPKIYHEPGRPKQTGVRHGRCFDVLIRQKISDQTAKHIQSKKGAVFWADSICVPFTYRSYTGARKMLPIKITGISFSLNV